LLSCDDAPGWTDRPGDDANVKLRRTLQVLLVAVAVPIASFGGYCGALIYSGNLHAVTDGVLYRSAQLSKEQFAASIRQYHVKSVLNLRGAHPHEAWWEDEVAATQENGAAHYDIALSSKRFVGEEQAERVLALIRDAPKPLLIHCRSGADRTGLVAALYRYAVEHADPAEADKQLSIAYGHFPYLTSKSGAMDQSFWAFVGHATNVAAAAK
jgi:protein tyrosine/serine phosphatase